MRGLRWLREARARLAFWRDGTSTLGYGCGCIALCGVFVFFLIAMGTALVFATMGDSGSRSVLVDRNIGPMLALLGTFFVGFVASILATFWWLIGARPGR